MSTSSIPLSFSLIETQNEISTKILNAILPEVNKYFNRNVNDLEKIIADIVVESITKQPEYAAIVSGTLQYELGIPDPVGRIADILNTIRNSSIVKKKPITIKSSGIVGGIKIEMIKKDFSDLLSLGSATLITEKGDQLNWLQWLLLDGDSIIISDHNFILGPSNYSRTGFGIMRETVGGFWRVPPEYAGNINDNWITRAISAASKDIDNAISKVFSA